MITFNFVSILNEVYDDLIDDIHFVREKGEEGKYHFKHTHDGREKSEITIEVANGDMFISVK